MKQWAGTLILLLVFGFLVPGGWAADVQMNGNVNIVGGSVTGTGAVAFNGIRS